MKKNNIFEVDIKGLRQLQSAKPKWFIIRELLQNAMDEDIKRCEIFLDYKNGKAHIGVTDDSPIGFRDLADAYTLFKDTYKRTNAQKRGRFNLGEKQVLCMADYARIVSTTGALEFEVLKGERRTLRRRREAGSEVYVEVRMTKDEFQECVDYCRQILLPKDIILVRTVNGQEEWDGIGYRFPYKTFKAKLLTELKEDDSMRRVSRETDVHIHKTEGEQAYVYEMGIPICEIDCDYSIDVQQKVPLSADRDNVDSKYLKTLYGEVLNHTVEEISKEQSSNIWVREGFTSDRADKETRQEIITKRFGEKALIANPNDKRSMDEAISHNYNVIYGSEMNKEEWAAIKQDELLVSTSSQFKVGVATGKSVSPTDAQRKIANFCSKVAFECLKINLTVLFFESPDATTKADYSSELNQLRFNVSHFAKSEWEPTPEGYARQPMVDLIIHELGHSQGWHYEHSYHECITMLGSWLVTRALWNPEWFKL